MSNVVVLNKSYDHAINKAIHDGNIRRDEYAGLHLTNNGIEDLHGYCLQLFKDIMIDGPFRWSCPVEEMYEKFTEAMIKESGHPVSLYIQIKYFNTESTEDIINKVLEEFKKEDELSKKE